jgi:hypothetical protein
MSSTRHFAARYLGPGEAREEDFAGVQIPIEVIDSLRKSGKMELATKLRNHPAATLVELATVYWNESGAGATD